MSKHQPYDLSFDQSLYLKRIQERANRRALPMKLAKVATQKIGKVLGIGSDKTSPAKEAKTHSYVASKQQQTSKSVSIEIGNLSPTITPPNDFILAKKQSTNAYAYGNQLHKAKIPYNNRSKS